MTIRIFAKAKQSSLAASLLVTALFQMNAAFAFESGEQLLEQTLKTEGASCPANYHLLSFSSATSFTEEACNLLDGGDVARIGYGATLSGYDNQCKITPADAVSAEVSLCAPDDLDVAESRGSMPGVDSDSKFIIYYGNEYAEEDTQTWKPNEDTLEKLAQFDVVVLQPNQWTFRPEIVEELKARGVDYVLGYISIGEDFIGGVEKPITGLGMWELKDGELVRGDNCFASFYMDVLVQDDINNVEETLEGNCEKGTGSDGNNIPDHNPIFSGLMVNPDATWRWLIDNMRIGANITARSTKAGLKQIADDRDIGRLKDRTADFGFDGFFLDTIDTAGPYAGAGWYPWVVDEMRDTVKYISDNYQDKIVLANRGAFYYTAGLQSPITGEYSIDYTIRPYVNAVLFESFRYDSHEATSSVTEYYNENRYNIAPKMFAEANRSDGFTVFSLEYEAKRQGVVQDAFDVGVRELGFVAYMAQDDRIDTFDFDFANRLPDTTEDRTPPAWETTGNVLYNQETEPEDRRVGVQSVTADKEGQVIVTWDIAIDQHYPITYDLIVTNNATGSVQTFENIAFEKADGWNQNPATVAANQFTLSGLSFGAEYNFRVIAEDAKKNRNTEDQGIDFKLAPVVSNPITANQIVVDGSLAEWGNWNGFESDPNDVEGVSLPGHISGAGNQANWRQIQMAHSNDTLYLGYTNETNIYVSWGFQIFIDADNDKSTGFSGGFAGLNSFPIGADYMIEGVNLYEYIGLSDDWSWQVASSTDGFQIGRAWQGKTGEVFLPLHWIGNPTGTISFIAFGNNGFYGHKDVFDWYPDNAAEGGVFKYKLQ